MSGHSKWAQIKRDKGANDVKKGMAFTKHSKTITLAVQQGGGIGDPNQNFRLRLAIDAARAVNMPKENIARAIEKASGKQGAIMEETVYEGFAPGGISFIVEATTDNKNRTTPEIKSLIEKNGGTMGGVGSVAYQFTQVGRILVAKGTKTLDDIFLIAADHGAEDIEEVEGDVYVYTAPGQVSQVRDALIKEGLEVKETEVMRKPNMVMEVAEGEEADKIMAFLERLEDHDDVQKVYSNFEIKA